MMSSDRVALVSQIRRPRLSIRMPVLWTLPVEVVLPALLGVAFIGLLTYEVQMREKLLLLMGLAGASLGVMVLVAPVIGLVALVAATAVVRMTISTGTESPIVASLGVGSVLLIGWFGHQVLNRQQVSYLPRSVSIPAIGFCGITVVSMLWGHIDLDPRISYHSTFYQVQIAATWLTIVSIGLLFVGADLFRERLLRSMLVWSIVGVGMLALPFKLSSAHVPVLSIGGLFGMWFVAVAWSQALANQRLHDALRVVLGMAAVSWLFMSLTVERQWVSGWVPATVAFIAVSLAARPALGRVLLAVAVMLAPLYYAMIYHTLVVDQQAEGSIGGEFGRVEMWQRGLGVIGDHLVLGTGPGGYALYYVTFIPDQAMSTHSNLIDILAQQGIVGAALFAMLLAGLWRLGRRLSGTPELHADRALLAAARGGMAGVIVSLFFGDWLIPFIYNQTIAGFDHSVYSWLMLAALCGLAADESRSDTPHA